MFERFTDQARKVLALAYQEAQRYNHEYIGTEHILLGLVKEGSGVGPQVLKGLNVDLPNVRSEVEKLVKRGPDMVTTGKLSQTPRARAVIQFSIEEARNFNHDYVGTEHLLLGLLREQEGVAAHVLANLGVSIEKARELVLCITDAKEPMELKENGVTGTETHESKAGFSVLYRSNWVVHLLTGFELQIERLLMAKDEAVRNANYEGACELREKVRTARKSVGQILREFDDLCTKGEKLLEDLRKP